jgi:hypothetical protein
MPCPTRSSRPSLNAAKLLAGRGEIALTQLRYAEAAERFKQAAALVPSGHSAETADCLDRQAIALYREGDEWGDTMALVRSVEILRLVLRYRTRDRVPLQWAATENNLERKLGAPVYPVSRIPPALWFLATYARGRSAHGPVRPRA